METKEENTNTIIYVNSCNGLPVFKYDDTFFMFKRAGAGFHLSVYENHPSQALYTYGGYTCTPLPGTCGMSVLSYFTGYCNKGDISALIKVLFAINKLTVDRMYEIYKEDSGIAAFYKAKFIISDKTNGVWARCKEFTEHPAVHRIGEKVYNPNSGNDIVLWEINTGNKNNA